MVGSFDEPKRSALSGPDDGCDSADDCAAAVPSMPRMPRAHQLIVIHNDKPLSRETERRTHDGTLGTVAAEAMAAADGPGAAAPARPEAAPADVEAAPPAHVPTKWNYFVEKNMRNLKGLDASSDPIGSDEALAAEDDKAVASLAPRALRPAPAASEMPPGWTPARLKNARKRVARRDWRFIAMIAATLIAAFGALAFG